MPNIKIKKGRFVSPRNSYATSICEMIETLPEGQHISLEFSAAEERLVQGTRTAIGTTRRRWKRRRIRKDIEYKITRNGSGYTGYIQITK